MKRILTICFLLISSSLFAQTEDLSGQVGEALRRGFKKNSTRQVNENVTMAPSKQILAATGTSSLPSIAGVGDENTGVNVLGGDVLTLSTAGTQRVKIDSNGYVLIGDGAPVLNRGLNVLGTNENTGLTLLNPTDYVGVLSSFGWANSGGDVSAGMRANRTALSNGPHDLEFFTRNSSSQTTTKMTIKSSGEVGIGTSTPQTTLDVVGSATIRGNLLVATGTEIFAQFTASGSFPCSQLASTTIDGLTASEATLVYNLTEHKFQYWNGSVWKSLATE